MKKKQYKCLKRNCEAPPVSAGLCEKHATERDLAEKQREEAMHLLRTSQVDNAFVDVPEIKEELHEIQDYFHKSCDSVINIRDYGIISHDEAESSFEWCISYAIYAIEAIRVYRTKNSFPESFEYNTQWIRERFNNLKAGLRSNGTPKQENNRK